MRILATGGTGFVGGHSVAALVADGHEVRLLARAAERVAPALVPLGVDPAAVEVRLGDVTDERAVRAAIAGCDALLHAAGVYSLDPRRGGEMRRVNPAGTAIALGQAAEAGLDPIVHVSSYVALLPGRPGQLLDGDAPVGTAPTPYAASKAASEAAARALQERGAPVRISYPGMVWGPHDPHLGESSRLALALLAGRLPMLPPGTMPVVNVRDVAAVHAALVGGRGRPRGRYVASAQNMPIAEVMRGADPSATVADLGVAFRRAEESIRDTVRWLHEAGHLPARRAGRLAAPA